MVTQSMTEMIEMEFYDSKREYREIHYDENKIKSRIGPYFRKKTIPYLSTKTKKELKLQTKMTTTGH